MAHDDRVGVQEKGDYLYGTFHDGPREESEGIRERAKGSVAVRVMMGITALLLLSLGYSLVPYVSAIFSQML